VFFEWRKESDGISGIFLISPFQDKLFPQEKRQLCISLRKRGYKGEFTTSSMNVFLDKKNLIPCFTKSLDGRLTCTIGFKVCHENMAIAC
jgi:hypothetical protein